MSLPEYNYIPSVEKKFDKALDMSIFYCENLHELLNERGYRPSKIIVDTLFDKIDSDVGAFHQGFIGGVLFYTLLLKQITVNYWDNEVKYQFQHASTVLSELLSSISDIIDKIAFELNELIEYNRQVVIFGMIGLCVNSFVYFLIVFIPLINRTRNSVIIAWRFITKLRLIGV